MSDGDGGCVRELDVHAHAGKTWNARPTKWNARIVGDERLGCNLHSVG
jgi:hypothetical protein